MSEVRASSFTEELQNVLSVLGLNAYYPEKITREKMYEITELSLSDSQSRHLSDFAWYFLERITQYNYNARNLYFDQIRSEQDKQKTLRRKFKLKSDRDNSATVIHPLDVLLAVFLCCDPFCKQDLCLHLWSCKLAIPFSICVEKSEPNLYLWPIRKLTTRWETSQEGKINGREASIATEPMKCIGFIRFGESYMSKSALINNIISDSEKTHPTFFHRDSAGSCKKKHLANGIIEIGWFFPKGLKSDNFDECIRLANLRGDVRYFPEQKQILFDMSNIVVLMCQIMEFKDAEDIVKTLTLKGKCVVVLFTNRTVSDDEADMIERFLDSLDAPETSYHVTALQDKQRPEIVQELVQTFKTMQHETNSSMEEIGIKFNEKHISVDEFEETCQGAKMAANQIIEHVSKHSPDDRKSSLLPLQGLLWEKWAKADKEIHRLQEILDEEDVYKYQEIQEQKKIQCRLNQADFIKDEVPVHLTLFIDALSVPSDLKRNFFSRWLKIMFDELSRTDLPPLFKKYKELMASLAVATGLDRFDITSKLEELDRRINHMSFGLEHMTRELSQAYEACHWLQHSRQAAKPKLQWENLPQLAALLLLDGYPLEVMDGDVSAVPIVWITGVMKELTAILRNRENKENLKIFVLSVLGIQSSGKSTLLNTMFGLQFAVSAGRCTRGVYLQLVKLEKGLQDHLKIDYVIAVDTEGLRSPELTSDWTRRHDNELSTFVIGLGDSTLINLMGENTTYLEEILPISVHAFLRMDAVGLHPKCAIVHHNVDKTNNEKLLQQGRILESILNNLTKVACEFERQEVRMFKEIIEFSFETDINYMPALLEGGPPMAPISSGYSNEAREMKKSLLTDLGIRQGQENRLDNFHAHIEQLWQAIKRDNFVYEFKNTMETEARGKLDQVWMSISSKLRRIAENFSFATHTRIMNCSSMEELSTTKEAILKEMKTVFQAKHLEQKEILDEFFGCTDKVYKSALLKWKPETEMRMLRCKEELERECKRQVDEYSEDQMRNLNVLQEYYQYQTIMTDAMQNLVFKMKNRRLSELAISRTFEQQWKGAMLAIQNKYPSSSRTVTIEVDACKILFEQFPSHRQLALEKVWNEDIDEEKKKHAPGITLKRYDLDHFKVCSKHWSYPSTNVSGGPDPEEHLKAIASDVKRETSKRLAELSKKCEPYNRSILSSFLADIAQRNMDRGRILVTPQFKVDLAAAVSGTAIKKLEELHSIYEQQKSPQAVLEKNKTKYFRLFKASIDKSNMIKFAAQTCYESIVKGIVDKLNRDLPLRLVEQIMTSPSAIYLRSKKIFLLDLLCQLAELNDFKKFYKYIHWPEEVIKERLTELVELSANKSSILSLGTSMAQDMLQQALKALNKTEKDFYTSGENASVSLRSWRNKFRKNAKDALIINDLKALHMIELECLDIVLFTEELRMQVLEARNSIQISVTDSVEDFSDIHQRTVEILLKDIIGCSASCPFCGEICVAIHKNHPGQHYTALHRPMCCIGYQYDGRSTLSSITCQQAVASSRSFVITDTKTFVPYKKYMDIYPRWHIVGDAALETSSFWKWFVVEFTEELELKYGCKNIDTPESWQSFSKDGEIQKFREIINL